MYKYLIQAKRVEQTEWLPMACPEIDYAEGMYEYCLTPDGGFDQVRMLKRNPDGRTWKIVKEASRF